MSKVFEQLDGIIRTTPATNPPTGSRSLYPKSDGWYELSAAGVERRLSNDVPGTSGPSKYRATFVGANGALTSTTVSKTDLATLTGAYVSEGVYTLTSGGTPFTANKTIPLPALGTATGAFSIKAEVTSTSVITIKTFDTSGAAADAIGTFFIDITVDV